MIESTANRTVAIAEAEVTGAMQVTLLVSILSTTSVTMACSSPVISNTHVIMLLKEVGMPAPVMVNRVLPVLSPNDGDTDETLISGMYTKFHGELASPATKVFPLIDLKKSVDDFNKSELTTRNVTASEENRVDAISAGKMGDLQLA
jgi:hypothetical protein